MRTNIPLNATQDAPVAHSAAGDALALSSALLASVSHDLRNPLSVILGASEALQDSDAHAAEDDRHGYLRAIRRECIRMDEYVQGLLQATRLLLGGTSRLSREWTNLEDIVWSAVDRLHRYRDDARVTVDIRSPVRQVLAHAPLVEQAVLNVLDNAVKFSPADATVRLRVAQDADGNTEIHVVDAGPGIPPSRREQVFRFFETGDPPARGRAGSGLGLSISRGIMRAHGGDVAAVDDDESPSGTRVVLTLPGRAGQ